MYSQDKINIALQVYHQCSSVTNTIRMLEYPTRRALYTWIENEGVQKPPRKVLDNTNTASHPRNPPVEVKMDAIHCCLELGESIKYVSEEIGYSRASIYAWRKKYLQGGTVALMNNKNIKPSTLVKGTQDFPNDEMQHLLARMDDMQMEMDILKETINVLKKDPGINMETLKNREKAVIVDALKGKYPLPLLLKRLKLPKSSYYYQETALKNRTSIPAYEKGSPPFSMKTTGVMGIAGYTPCSAAREPSYLRRWCAGSWRRRGLWSGSRAGGNITLIKGKSRLLRQMR